MSIDTFALTARAILQYASDLTWLPAGVVSRRWGRVLAKQ